jgi:hypothetical protein
VPAIYWNLATTQTVVAWSNAGVMELAAHAWHAGHGREFLTDALRSAGTRGVLLLTHDLRVLPVVDEPSGSAPLECRPSRCHACEAADGARPARTRTAFTASTTSRIPTAAPAVIAQSRPSIGADPNRVCITGT